MFLKVYQLTQIDHRMRIVLLLIFLHSSSGFLMTEAEPGLIRVAPGDTVTLFCAVDDDYEWCKFYHPSGQFCDFEWKRSESNITMQECELSDRVEFHGNYDDRECGITFTATEEDTGVWKCEIEEYVTWRSRGAGRVETAQMNVTVHARTTPATAETTMPTLSTTVSTKKDSTTTYSSTTTSSAEPIDSVKSLDETNASETPEAIPRVDENDNSKAGGSSFAILGVLVFIIVIVAVVSGGVYYRRKNRSTAAMIFDQEAKLTHDQTTMVRNSIPNLTFHSNNVENSNLHEYHPPNLTHSSVTPESEA